MQLFNNKQGITIEVKFYRVTTNHSYIKELYTRKIEHNTQFGISLTNAEVADPCNVLANPDRQAHFLRNCN